MPARTGTRRLTMAAVAALALVGGAIAANATGAGSGGHGHGPKVVRVSLHDVDGSKVARVKLYQTRGKVVVTGHAWGLTPGFHGFHIHTVGLCEADAPNGPFTTAGGHFTGGLLTNHADHAGDMPSLLVTADGRAFASFATDRFTLADLRDSDGSAVMVHAGRDNFANIPSDRYASASGTVPDATTLMTGDAGARVACGVID
jgi:Cu-Zn family superoxide dismutase